MAVTEQIINIHAQALGKPCKALVWHDESQHYRCGMVIEPSRFVKWCPKRMDKIASKVFKRWIAADTLCDADVEMD